MPISSWNKKKQGRKNPRNLNYSSVMSKCSDCAHLTLDSDVVEKEALFFQIMCVFCKMPLKSSPPSQSSQAVQTLPLVSDCGHFFHGLCLERRERLYPHTPIRCPMDGLIITKTRSLNVRRKEVFSQKDSDSIKKEEL